MRRFVDPALLTSDVPDASMGNGKFASYVRFLGHQTRKNRSVFLVRGLRFAQTLIQAQDVAESCAIVPTKANELLQRIHDRMPVILSAADYDRWRDLQDDDPADLIRQYAARRSLGMSS